MKVQLNILIILFLSLQLNAQKQKIYSVDQLKQDFSVFKQALLELHPGLFRYTSKSTVENNFNTVESMIQQPMDEEQFYKLLNPIVANIKCGHTKFFSENKPDDFYAFHQLNLFPLKLYFQNNRAYALASYNASLPFKAGAEIISINHRPVADIIQFLFSNIFSDGNVISSKYQELNRQFPGYYATFIETQSSYNIDYKETGSDDIHSITIPSVSFENIKASIKKTGETEPFKLSFIGKETALLRISVFMQVGKEKYSAFLKRTFSELKSKNIKNLILDLRDNDGGEDHWGAQLYSYLTDKSFRYYDHLTIVSKGNYKDKQCIQLPKFYWLAKIFIHKKDSGYVFTKSKNLHLQHPEINAYLGKLYILENGNSFSVTSEFEAIASDLNRATFIGEESGGAKGGNNSGAFAFVKLPNSHLQIAIPLLGYYMHINNKKDLDRGIMPDYIIVPSVNDILNSNDQVLQATLNMINK